MENWQIAEGVLAVFWNISQAKTMMPFKLHLILFQKQHICPPPQLSSRCIKAADFEGQCFESSARAGSDQPRVRQD